MIAAVKRAVSRIPVIGNGDVMSRGDGIRMMEETGCDLVMIGRGALGNPWIFDKDHEGRPSPEELKAVMLRHLTDTAELKGDHIAVLEMRKHVGWYLKGRPGAAAFRDQVNRIDDLEELKNETPLMRLGTPEDIANAVEFLVSEKASFITGQVLSVNGGFVI